VPESDFTNLYDLIDKKGLNPKIGENKYIYLDG
jgi:hypothetical protein